MKVAVVGSGVSGLAAAWLLNEYSGHQVHLYESDDRPGGHANTITYSRPDRQPAEVDTGFVTMIVFNPDTYPNFLRFLQMFPKIKVAPTEMTFSVSRDRGRFEWAGKGLSTVFCQTRRLLDPSMWRMIYDMLRFNACARRIIVKGSQYPHNISIGEFLLNEGYSDSFRDNYLIPMTAAIWSTPPDKLFGDFPAYTLIRFMYNHHLLQVTGKPKWLTLQGGTRSYVNEIVSSLPEGSLRLSTSVVSAESTESNQVLLTTSEGKEEEYDHVIMACHSDTSLAILKAGNITKDEGRILSGFQWNGNEVVVHSDDKLMPKRHGAWSCWNYLTATRVNKDGVKGDMNDQVSLTYWMNELQHLPAREHGSIFVTLNPPFEPAPKSIFARFRYQHPVIDTKAVALQNEMHLIQNTRGISYAGAWLKYGFHEDGFTSGLRAVVDNIPDVNAPYKIQYADAKPDMPLIAHVFDWLEWSGMRSCIGVLLSFVLACVSLTIRLDESEVMGG